MSPLYFLAVPEFRFGLFDRPRIIPAGRFGRLPVQISVQGFHGCMPGPADLHGFQFASVHPALNLVVGAALAGALLNELPNLGESDQLVFADVDHFGGTILDSFASGCGSKYDFLLDHFVTI